MEGGFLSWLCVKFLVEGILSGIHPLLMPDCFPRNGACTGGSPDHATFPSGHP